MTKKIFHGLLECPYHRGWIEFDYHSGDKISDLSVSIDSKWGRLKDAYGQLLSMNASSWAFFCAQLDGSYLALRKSDLIPTEPPKGKGQHIHDSQAFWADFPETLDVLLLDNKLWKGFLDTPVEIIENFSIDLNFKRRYKVPKRKSYDTRLVALWAIVGG